MNTFLKKRVKGVLCKKHNLQTPVLDKFFEVFSILGQICQNVKQIRFSSY